MNKAAPVQYEIWIANLNPTVGSEPGKVRPIVVLQSDILNKRGHATCVVCAISSQQKDGFSLIRVPVEPDALNGLLKKSYILSDQIRSMDISRFKERIGMLDKDTIVRLHGGLRAILTL